MSNTSSNKNGHNNNNGQREQKNTQTSASTVTGSKGNTDSWTENLRRNQEQRVNDRKWFNMQPGEKTVLEFTPQFGPVYKDFDGDGINETLRYEYHVIDMNHREAGPKPWDVSKRWSEAIDRHLQKGHRVLKVERVGGGMKTNYYFEVVDAGGAASSS